MYKDFLEYVGKTIYQLQNYVRTKFPLFEN